jgi:hypothetical protein
LSPLPPTAPNPRPRACRKASWSATAAGWPDLCHYPAHLFSPRSEQLFGRCEFTGPAARAGLGLADEITAAAAAALPRAAPARPDKLLADEALYWGRMSNGTGIAYPRLGGAGEDSSGAAPRGRQSRRGAARASSDGGGRRAPQQPARRRACAYFAPAAV